VEFIEECPHGRNERGVLDARRYGTIQECLEVRDRKVEFIEEFVHCLPERLLFDAARHSAFEERGLPLHVQRVHDHDR
jgi:hypothetical protein